MRGLHLAGRLAGEMAQLYSVRNGSSQISVYSNMMYSDTTTTHIVFVIFCDLKSQSFVGVPYSLTCITIDRDTCRMDHVAWIIETF